MSYTMKKIKEKELAGFLLNPFEKVAYFGELIIQKVQRNNDVDDFLCLDLYRNRVYKTGFILYEKGEIIVERMYVINYEVIDKPPFVTIEDLEEKIKETIMNKVEEAKIYRLDEIRSLPLYGEIKDSLTSQYFSPMVFAKLGTTYNLYEVESATKGRISRFVDGLIDNDIISLASGSVTPIQTVIDALIKDNNFIASEIVKPEIKEAVDKYIAAGKFTKREQILIDYLDKTKASGAKRFTVETLVGEKVSCRNEVTERGQVLSVDEKCLIDVAKIKSVKYGGKFIYKKTIA